ncbi:FAD-binding oxidoreductase [Micromonospora polyrhachis]|uniref:FAD-binding oxidoreductase n=1 Tax=Micromonospora polyrhachis TaxID=1282883 RepID=UPI001FE41238|nr:FAD-binding oxidoreductase [Micromonospora polyrhachis]
MSHVADGMRSISPESDVDVVRRLAHICGLGFTRAAGPADEVGGAPARWVAAPATASAVGAVLRTAADHDLTVVPRGAGTKLDWGAAPTQLDIVLDTGRLAGIHRWSRQEQTVEVGAGTPLRAVQAALGKHGHRLAVDVRSVDATVGGVLATNEVGPLCHRHGTPGDQVMGVSYVDAAGVPTHAGGWAAGESPGYDLARLLCGSYGALGVLVSATLRVRPVPARRLWVSRPVWTPWEMHTLVGEILATPLAPAAIELDLPADLDLSAAPGPPAAPGRPVDSGWAAARRSHSGPPAGSLTILLEGDSAEVTTHAARLRRLLGDRAEATDSPPPWWQRYPFGPDDIALRIAVPVGDLHAAVYALRDAVGAPVPVRGAAGLGVVYAVLPPRTPPHRVAAILAAMRGVLLARDGSCVVVTAPPAVRRSVDLWGALPDLSARRRIKEHFDPYRRLAPGRYPGDS